MQNLEKTIHLFLLTLPNISNKTITVGFSGGADSTALLHILCKKKSFFNFKIQAIFFNHGNSPLAQDENLMESFCQSFCKDREIPLSVIKTNLSKIKNQSWESSGRIIRNSFYANINTDYIFLGHHLDDLNETTLIQLFRGGGKGITGMAPITGKFCRPFLSITKEHILSYLKEHQLSWIEDPTNKNNDFTRNFWRNSIIPTLKKHYNSFSSLDSFRKKYQELNHLSLELANNDGLFNLITNHQTNINLLSKSRLKNLIFHYLKHLKINKEDKFIDNLISHIFNKKDVNFNISKDLHLSISNDTLQFNSIPSSKNSYLRNPNK